MTDEKITSNKFADTSTGSVQSLRQQAEEMLRRQTEELREVRPEDIQVADAARKCVNRIQGRVEEKLYAGSIVRLVVDIEREKIMVDAHKGISVSPSDLIEIGWNSDAGSIILQD